MNNRDKDGGCLMQHNHSIAESSLGRFQRNTSHAASSNKHIKFSIHSSYRTTNCIPKLNIVAVTVVMQVINKPKMS